MQRHRATFDCRLRRRLCTTNQNNCTSTHTSKQVHTDTHTGMQTHSHTLGPASLRLRHTTWREGDDTECEEWRALRSLWPKDEKWNKADNDDGDDGEGSAAGQNEEQQWKKKNEIIIKWQLNISLSNRPNSNDSPPCLISCCLPRSTVNPQTPLPLNLLWPLRWGPSSQAARGWKMFAHLYYVFYLPVCLCVCVFMRWPRRRCWRQPKRGALCVRSL